MYVALPVSRFVLNSGIIVLIPAFIAVRSRLFFKRARNIPCLVFKRSAPLQLVVGSVDTLLALISSAPPGLIVPVSVDCYRFEPRWRKFLDDVGDVFVWNTSRGLLVISPIDKDDA